ncbi:MAG: PD-(D/E)XK nuclease family protein [Actinomycetaceae bacterium]|nr:PD-(D/E)XK nuclease family protein [Actinomycetaceae bacterium]
MTPSRVLPALSASRAKEYLRCPLQYRLHVVDGMKEPPTRATVLGTLVHSALEDLYDLPAQERTNDSAQQALSAHWEKKKADPTTMELFSTSEECAQWEEEMRRVLSQYFHVENPQWLSPIARERMVEATTPAGIRLRGIIDRVDRAPNGDLRVVDYKTGKAPAQRYIDDALYQMRFYALLLLLAGALPKRLQLLYLKSGQVLTLDPEEPDIRRFGDEVESLWERIENDAHAGHFAPRRNPLCNWCGVQSACPIFGGTTPPLPEEGRARLLQTRVGHEN